MIDRQHLGTKALGDPFYVLLVLFLIEGAGAVDQYAAGFERVPYVHQNTPLPLCASAYCRRAPFCASLLVLAEHTFARTRRIDYETVE